MIQDFKLRQNFPNKCSKNYAEDQNPMILRRYPLFNIDTIKISNIEKNVTTLEIFSPSFFQEERIKALRMTAT